MNDVKRTGVHGLRMVALLTALIMMVSACVSPTGQGTTTSVASTTSSTTRIETTEAPEPEEPFRIGLTDGITTDNWWASLDTHDQPQNRAYLASSKTTLFELSLPGFVLVPVMAATDAPVQPVQEGDNWIVEQPIRRDVAWSDGEPVTASDLVFYFETVRQLGLMKEHATNLPSSVMSITAPDDYTVRIQFSERPGLALWNGVIARAPFVPGHWWQEHVESAREAAASAATEITPQDALAAIVAEANADEDRNDPLDPADVTEEQIADYVAAAAAAEGRTVLYGVSGIGEPAAGPVVVDSWEPGELARTVPNPDYFARGVEKTIYSDGSVRIADSARGTDDVYEGPGTGDVIAHYIEGPFVPEIAWVEHDTREEAYEALVAGDVDYVFDPNGMTVELRDELSSRTDLQFSASLSEGLRYLAFNLRKPPMSDVVFRRAVATLIDKESIAEEVLADAVSHPDLIGHHNDEVPRPGWRDGEPMEDGARLQSALQILEEAGYTWGTAPVIEVDDAGETIGVTPGQGLTMPNGESVPALSILAPGPDYDPFRNTFAIEIGSALQNLGIPVTVEEREFDSIVATVLPPQTPESALGWDMYVLGWGAADPLIPGTSARAFFHSDQDSVFGGGFNTTGYSSPEFDEIANAFDAATSMSEAASLSKEMDAVLARDVPYVVLFRTRIIEASGPDVEFPTPSIMGGHQGYPHVWPSTVRMGD
jgi:peptide/nickel transport system substrate-binding protein